MENGDQGMNTGATRNGALIRFHMHPFGWGKAPEACAPAGSGGSVVFDLWGHPLDVTELASAAVTPEGLQRQGGGSRSVNLDSLLQVRGEGVWGFDKK